MASTDFVGSEFLPPKGREHAQQQKALFRLPLQTSPHQQRLLEHELRQKKPSQTCEEPGAHHRSPKKQTPKSEEKPSTQKNSVVPIKLTSQEVLEIASNAKNHDITIDVDHQVLSCGGKDYNFELDELKKEFILKGGFMKFLDSKVPQIKAWLAK